MFSQQDIRRDNIINCLLEFKDDQFNKIEKERRMNRNQPYAFQDLGSLGEELALMMFPNSIGSGSKGGCAFDNIELNEDGKIIKSREIKMVSLDGTKECVSEKCKGKRNKAPTFQLKCCYCDESQFNFINDSRCGISASAHIKYAKEANMDEYILIVSKFNHSMNCITVKCFKILSCNEYFDNYLKIQHEEGKGDTANLLPYSYDFHLSGPILLWDFELYPKWINSVYFNLDNNDYLPIPKINLNSGKTIFTNSILTKYSDNVTENLFDTNNGYLNYLDNINKFRAKKKNLGKERGDTNRIKNNETTNIEIEI
jgi:hypothetical protein